MVEVSINGQGKISGLNVAPALTLNQYPFFEIASNKVFYVDHPIKNTIRTWSERGNWLASESIKMVFQTDDMCRPIANDGFDYSKKRFACTILKTRTQTLSRAHSFRLFPLQLRSVQSSSLSPSACK